MPLLESKIRREGGTRVDMPNAEGEADTTYHFKPLDPTRADSPHVADVPNMTHFARFIAADITTFVPFEGKAAKVDLPKPVATPAPVAEVVKADPVTDAVSAELPGWADLQAGIKAGAYSQEQLREFLAVEEAAESPRKGYITAITKALT